MAGWLRRVAAAVAAALGLVLFAVPAAHAIDCTGDAPALQTPADAPGASFDSGPKNPVRGDPFADPPTSTIYETYGYAGLQWTTYDLGCGEDIARSPMAVIGTWTANVLNTVSQGAVAMSASMTRWALNPGIWLAPLDGLMERGADVFREPAVRWLALAALALAVIMAVRANQSAYAETASMVGRLLVIATVAALLFGFPSAVARIFDSSVAWVVDTVNRGMTGDTTTESAELGTGITANIHEAVLYETWKQGAFGSADSPAAEAYADPIFATLSRTVTEDRLAQLTDEECAIAGLDPCGREYAAELAEEKGAEYKVLAAEVKEMSPTAYDHLIGQNSSHRLWTALVGGFAATVSVIFQTVAAFLMAVGFLAMRLLVMFGFVLIVLAVLWPGKALAAVYTTAGLVFNGVWFGIGAGVFATVQKAFIGSTLPAWASGLLILATAYAFWRLTKGMRKVPDGGAYAASRGWARRHRLRRRRRSDMEDAVRDGMSPEESPDETVAAAAVSTANSPHVMAVAEPQHEGPTQPQPGITAGRTPAALPAGSPEATAPPPRRPAAALEAAPVSSHPDDPESPSEASPRPQNGASAVAAGATAAAAGAVVTAATRSPAAGAATTAAVTPTAKATDVEPAPPPAPLPEVVTAEDTPPGVIEAPVEHVDGQSIYQVYVPQEAQE